MSNRPHAPSDTNSRVADAPSGNWVYRVLPRALWPHAQLARWDRPIGWQLLMWPCFWSAALAANVASSPANIDTVWSPQLLLWHLFLFMAGAIAMRGAGCTWNDLVDYKIDAKVARTRSRPLPSGRITRFAATVFLVVQALVGLLVLVQFNGFSILLGIASLGVVAIYPFAKRFTDWPQFFLGLAFSWGALMGWAAVFAELALPPLLLYAGAIAWTIGYDTIYAHQDRRMTPSSVCAPPRDCSRKTPRSGLCCSTACLPAWRWRPSGSAAWPGPPMPGSPLPSCCLAGRSG